MPAASLMEGVEDLPKAVLTTGLPWTWESFPEYLDWLDGRQYDADIAIQAAKDGEHKARRAHRDERQLPGPAPAFPVETGRRA